MALRRWAATLGAAASIALLAVGFTAGTATAADGGGSMVVRPGDTVWAIAERNGVPIETIVRVNHLADPNHIVPGQRLALGRPPGPNEAVRGAAARELLTASRPLRLTSLYLRWCDISEPLQQALRERYGESVCEFR